MPGFDPSPSGDAERRLHIIKLFLGMGVRCHRERDVHLPGRLGVDIAQLLPVRLAVDLESRPRGARLFEDPFDVEGVGLAFSKQPARQVSDEVDVGILDRADDALGHHVLGLFETGVDRGDDAVDLAQGFVVVVHSSVRKDVHLHPAEDLKTLRHPV